MQPHRPPRPPRAASTRKTPWMQRNSCDLNSLRHLSPGQVRRHRVAGRAVNNRLDHPCRVSLPGVPHRLVLAATHRTKPPHQRRPRGVGRHPGPAATHRSSPSSGAGWRDYWPIAAAGGLSAARRPRSSWSSSHSLWPPPAMTVRPPPAPQQPARHRCLRVRRPLRAAPLLLLLPRLPRSLHHHHLLWTPQRCPGCCCPPTRSTSA